MVDLIVMKKQGSNITAEDIFLDLIRIRQFLIIVLKLTIYGLQYYLQINQFVQQDLQNNLNGSLGYIHYLISDYKKDRWFRRGAFIQMHENLNTAVRAGVRCLFY